MAFPIFRILLLFSLFFISQRYCLAEQSPTASSTSIRGNLVNKPSIISTPESHSYKSKSPHHHQIKHDVKADKLESTISTTSSPEGSTTVTHKRMPIVMPNFSRVAIPFVVAIWVFSASIVKIVLKSFPRVLQLIPDSCWLILAGIAMGSILFVADLDVLSPLSPTVFFFCMLPPIILDAGFFMPNRPFFDHLGTILLFAVVGTIFNTFTIGISLWACGLTGLYGFDIPLLETMVFSSLISAVDPVAVLAVFEEIHVDQVLYIIVFGESLLNDAVTVVLYNMFDNYLDIGTENIDYIDVFSGLASFTVVAVGGSAVGICWGFMTGFVTKFTHEVLLIEPVFIFVMSYLAYLNAEAFQMSGILAIMFCGITMKNYVAENVSAKSLTTVKCGLKMFSHSSEAVIFMFLGISTVNDQHEWNTPFILLTVLFCCVYRAIGVVLLTELANYFRLQQLNRVEKFVMSYGGLRGAIAFALVLLIDPQHVPRQPLFVTATITVVFFTVFVQGITIRPLVEFLKVKREEKRDKTMNERIHEKLIDYTMAGMEDVLGRLSSHKLRDKFKQFDYAYIRPLLIREKAAQHEPKILETYSKLTMKDAVDFARRNPSGWAGDPRRRGSNGPASESFANLLRNHTTVDLSANNDGVVPGDPGWNLDIGELNYNPSNKDVTDAKMHHLLSDATNWRPHRSKSHDRGEPLSGRPTNHRHSRKTSSSSSSGHKHHRSKRWKSHEGKYAYARKVASNVEQEINAISHEPEQRKKELLSAANRNSSYDFEAVSFTASGPTLHDEILAALPAAVEMHLPWKTRDEDYDPLRQAEFMTRLDFDGIHSEMPPSANLLSDSLDAQLPPKKHSSSNENN